VYSCDLSLCLLHIQQRATSALYRAHPPLAQAPARLRFAFEKHLLQLSASDDQRISSSSSSTAAAPTVAAVQWQLALTTMAPHRPRLARVFKHFAVAAAARAAVAATAAAAAQVAAAASVPTTATAVKAQREGRYVTPVGTVHMLASTAATSAAGASVGAAGRAAAAVTTSAAAAAAAAAALKQETLAAAAIAEVLHPHMALDEFVGLLLALGLYDKLTAVAACRTAACCAAYTGCSSTVSSSAGSSSSSSGSDGVLSEQCFAVALFHCCELATHDGVCDVQQRVNGWLCNELLPRFNQRCKVHTLWDC
jgi:hypothetical protein